MTPDLAMIRAAAERIRGHVRRTPLVAAAPARQHRSLGDSLVLKLEALQVTGSFKPRGAINATLALTPHERARGIVTASGGNHGLAVAYAGAAAGVPATVFLPQSAAAGKIAKIEGWGARAVIEGAAWDDSDRAARRFAVDSGCAYIHPFADPAVIAGQGTIALEILENAPETDTLVVAIGGGGLISGIALAAAAIKPGIRVIGVEPVGAPTLYASLAAGRLETLARLDTAAVTLAPRRSDAINLAVIGRHVAQIVLVDDDEMRAAASWLWREFAVAAELSGAAAVAALLGGHYRPARGEHVCAVVCGAGTDGIG